MRVRKDKEAKKRENDWMKGCIKMPWNEQSMEGLSKVCALPSIKDAKGDYAQFVEELRSKEQSRKVLKMTREEKRFSSRQDILRTFSTEIDSDSTARVNSNYYFFARKYDPLATAKRIINEVESGDSRLEKFEKNKNSKKSIPTGCILIS